MDAVLYSTDLTCSSRVSAAAARVGATLQTAMSVEALLEKAAGKTLAILDLNTPSADLGELAPQLRARLTAPATIVAFGPHVHEKKLTAALDAGCDVVLTQGQFYGGLDDLLAPTAAG